MSKNPKDEKQPKTAQQIVQEVQDQKAKDNDILKKIVTWTKNQATKAITSTISLILGEDQEVNKICPCCGTVLESDEDVCHNCGEQFHYALNDEEPEIIVTEISNKKITTKKLPEDIDGVPVTIIGRDAFKNCSKLKSIKLPNKVTTISDSAFEGCSVLTDITLPETLTKIGYHAFYLCKKLSTINFLGTKAQWSKIDVSNLCLGKSYVIICSDGKFKIKQS